MTAWNPGNCNWSLLVTYRCSFFAATFCETTQPFRFDCKKPTQRLFSCSCCEGKGAKIHDSIYCISARLCSVWLEFRAAKLSGSFDYGIVSGIYQLQIYGQLCRLRPIISACLLSWRCCGGIGASDAAVTQIAAQHPKHNHVDRRTKLPDVRLILNIAPHIFADFTMESM